MSKFRLKIKDGKSLEFILSDLKNKKVAANDILITQAKYCISKGYLDDAKSILLNLISSLPKTSTLLGEAYYFLAISSDLADKIQYLHKSFEILKDTASITSIQVMYEVFAQRSSTQSEIQYDLIIKLWKICESITNSNNDSLIIFRIQKKIILYLCEASLSKSLDNIELKNLFGDLSSTKFNSILEKIDSNIKLVKKNNLLPTLDQMSFNSEFLSAPVDDNMDYYSKKSLLREKPRFRLPREDIRNPNVLIQSNEVDGFGILDNNTDFNEFDLNFSCFNENIFSSPLSSKFCSYF